MSTPEGRCHGDRRRRCTRSPRPRVFSEVCQACAHDRWLRTAREHPELVAEVR